MDVGAVAAGVVQGAEVGGASPDDVVDAVVGEVEAAMPVHHEIVGRAQRTAGAVGVQVGDLAVVVDALDQPPE